MATDTKRRPGAMPELIGHGIDMSDPTTNCKHYRVEPGDTLLAIAEREYGNAHDWRRIFEANASSISNPLALRPGQKIKIPF